jgi:hypothetical protein
MCAMNRVSYLCGHVYVHIAVRIMDCPGRVWICCAIYDAARN